MLSGTAIKKEDRQERNCHLLGSFAARSEFCLVGEGAGEGLGLGEGGPERP